SALFFFLSSSHFPFPSFSLPPVAPSYLERTSIFVCSFPNSLSLFVAGQLTPFLLSLTDDSNLSPPLPYSDAAHSLSLSLPPQISRSNPKISIQPLPRNPNRKSPLPTASTVFCFFFCLSSFFFIFFDCCGLWF
ncbi:Uncharacterized protein TCM_033466, partial [Theobroma cacao]